MPQGKYKVKNKAPVDSKKPKKVANARKNCPIAPKKWKYNEQGRINKTITKNVNRKIEEEIRAAVTDAPKVFFAKKKKQIQQRVPEKKDKPQVPVPPQS
ncbi:uncharacterized protein LOC135842630 [Planococcus citri]|uniref:uncharacterized protein LOC135842630 n=1 Tax=Planococcus citri TaxID=170843 RepID=UPI0031F8A1EC